MGKISKRVLEKIKKGNIKPIPKWQFMLKGSFVWILFGINLILGSIGFAIIMYLLVNNDSVLDFSLTKDIVEWIFLSIPILWILLTVFFLFVAYYNFKNTEGGYRLSAGKKVLINITITIFLGLTLYVFGFSQRLNNIFSENVSFYTHTFDRRDEIWMRPEEGFLSGEIMSINEETEEMVLRDLNGKEWSVAYGDAIIKSRVVFDVGERIKILGKALPGNVFEAFEIRPWGGMGRRMQENN